MKRPLRKILRIGIVLAVIFLLVITAFIVFFFAAKPRIKGILEKQLAKRTGISLHAGRLDYSLFPLHVTAEDVKVAREDDLQKIDLTLARLDAKGNFWKLVRGRKPALDSVEAHGAVLRFRQKAPPKKSVDLKATAIRAGDLLSWTKGISIVRSSLAFSLPALEGNLEGVNVSLAPGDEGSTWTYSAKSSALEAKDRAGTLSLNCDLSSTGTLRLAQPIRLDANMTLGSGQVVVPLIQGLPAGITVEAAGVFDPATMEVKVSKLKMRIPGLLYLEGTAGGKFGKDSSLETELNAQISSLESMAATLGPRLPAGFRGVRLRGEAALSGRYRSQRLGQEKTDDLDGSLSFEDAELDHALEGVPVHARVSGKIQAAGPSRSPRLSADIRATVGKVSRGKVRIGGTDALVAAAGTQGAVKISNLEASLHDISLDGLGGKKLAIDKAVLSVKGSLDLSRGSPASPSLETRFGATLKDLSFAAAEGKNISFDQVTLKGKAGLDLGGKTVVLDSFEVGLPGFPPLSASGRAALKKPPAVEARFEVHGLDLPTLRTLAAPFIPKNLSGWDLAGAADFSAEVRRPSASGVDWGFSGGLSLAQVRLNDPSFTVASEGISPAIRIEGEYAPARGLAFKSEVDISQGESLWKAVYISWSKHPLKITAAGRYDPGSGRMDALTARFVLPALGEIGLTGWAAARPSPSFDLLSDARLSLGPLYSLYAQAGVSEEQRMTLAGTLGAGLHFQKDDGGLSIAGKLTLAGVDLERQLTKTILRNVDAEVPVHLEIKKTPPDPPETPLPEEGFLRIAEFRNPMLALNSLDIPMRVGVNAFSIEPMSVELFGGRADLGRTVFLLDLKARSIQGTGSLALRDLDISRIPIQSPQFKLTGKIRADFPRFEISRDEIILSGRGEASVFGGQVILRDLAVSEPFSPGRSTSLNLDLVDLDLKKLTDEVPFGEVTGIIRGEVRNLVITYRQPEQFELLLESVPRKGVPKTFSLKAVDDLTVLSSGGQATAGTSRFWMRFIRGFRYRKLGIVSTLRNDTFTLNGTIHEGGLEYLVKRTPLFGISVVNRLPRNVISFKEMMSRLKRIGQSENVPLKKEEMK